MKEITKDKTAIDDIRELIKQIQEERPSDKINELLIKGLEELARKFATDISKELRLCGCGEQPYYKTQNGYWAIQCICGLSTRTTPTKADAQDIWNTAMDRGH